MASVLQFERKLDLLAEEGIHEVIERLNVLLVDLLTTEIEPELTGRILSSRTGSIPKTERRELSLKLNYLRHVNPPLSMNSNGSIEFCLLVSLRELRSDIRNGGRLLSTTEVPCTSEVQ